MKIITKVKNLTDEEKKNFLLIGIAGLVSGVIAYKVGSNVRIGKKGEKMIDGSYESFFKRLDFDLTKAYAFKTDLIPVPSDVGKEGLKQLGVNRGDFVKQIRIIQK